MSSINGNGKGNLLITYLFPMEDSFDQIDLENKLKNSIAKILHEHGIEKFVIADDEFIKEELLEKSEKRIDIKTE